MRVKYFFKVKRLDWHSKCYSVETLQSCNPIKMKVGNL